MLDIFCFLQAVFRSPFGSQKSALRGSRISVYGQVGSDIESQTLDGTAPSSSVVEDDEVETITTHKRMCYQRKHVQLFLMVALFVTVLVIMGALAYVIFFFGKYGIIIIIIIVIIIISIIVIIIIVIVLVIIIIIIIIAIYIISIIIIVVIIIITSSSSSS